MVTRILDYVNGQWTEAGTQATLPVVNPASAEVIGQVVLTPREAVAQAVDIAQEAFQTWRRVPVLERVQPLFRLKFLL